MTEDFLDALIGRYASAITCFCFMGGDADPSEIQRLAFWIIDRFPRLRTAWYSGRQELPDGFDLRSMNYIKLGPYIEELGGLKSPTTNQVFYVVGPDGTMIPKSL
jgi:anaerobic ribonucleoside-triphosphate reductase activating protein